MNRGLGQELTNISWLVFLFFFDFANFWIFQIRSIKHHPTPQHRGSHLLIKSFTLQHTPGAEEKQVSRHPPGLVWCNLGQAMASHGHLFQCNVIFNLESYTIYSSGLCKAMMMSQFKKVLFHVKKCKMQNLVSVF